MLGPLRARYLKSAFFQCSPQWGYAAVKITGRKNRQDFSNMTTKHVIKKYRSNAWYQCNVCINMVSLALDKIIWMEEATNKHGNRVPKEA